MFADHGARRLYSYPWKDQESRSPLRVPRTYSEVVWGAINIGGPTFSSKGSTYMGVLILTSRTYIPPNYRDRWLGDPPLQKTGA